MGEMRREQQKTGLEHRTEENVTSETKCVEYAHRSSMSKTGN